MLHKMLSESRSIALAIRFWYQFMAGLAWIWLKVVRPVLGPGADILAWIWRRWRALWDMVVYDKDGKFRWHRAGVAIIATLVALWVLPIFGGLFLDTAIYAFTGRTETLYLTQSQEIDPENDVHSIKGCTVLECDESETVYFRVRPSLFNHLWSLVVRQDLMFPDEVAATVPPGTTQCEIHRYGLRAKFLRRGFDIYPEALSISCHIESLGVANKKSQSHE